ncbi:ABC transporter substrate-binding protein [Roseovarius tibetensis]|uniref:ABC transporter substrate-binding protein n=1 Tax=Roseovarius tibetensis TaxID=2685897 RepID=UPI003D7FC3E2
MRVLPLIVLCLSVAFTSSGALADTAPRRVVSINLCTDQLAMMLADPGQLISVSDLASDPHSSAMAEAARAYPVNHGRAEEVYLLDPDLVLAGAYTARATVEMLRGVGIEVVQFAPASSLADTRDRITKMARVLGHKARGAALIAKFDARLDALSETGANRPRAAIYHPNGYTLGGGTLSNDILQAAGFRNLAREMGLRGGGTVPVETLVMAAPDLLISGTPLPGESRSEAVLDHPALDILRATRAGMQITSPSWICGTPHALDAVDRLVQTRKRMAEHVE